MTPVFPIHLFRMHLLAEVPRSVYSEAPQCQDALNPEKRRGFLARLRRGSTEDGQLPHPRETVRYELNAAVWLHFTEQPAKPVSLALVYGDSSGEYAVIVDEVSVSPSGSAMLSGNVTIESKGPIQSLKACCLGLTGSPSFSVDELYVQKTNAAETTQRRRLA